MLSDVTKTLNKFEFAEKFSYIYSQNTVFFHSSEALYDPQDTVTSIHPIEDEEDL